MDLSSLNMNQVRYLFKLYLSTTTFCFKFDSRSSITALLDEGFGCLFRGFHCAMIKITILVPIIYICAPLLVLRSLMIPFAPQAYPKHIPMPYQRIDNHGITSGAAPTNRMHNTTTMIPSNHAKTNSDMSMNKRQMPEQLPRFSTILVARSNNTRPTGRFI